MAANQLVVTGDTITVEPNALIGHGLIQPHHHSDTATITLSGIISRVNKLITVNSLNHRYRGEIGDIVIGRINSIYDNKWRVDIESCNLGVLGLNAVYLPDAIQRRKTIDDELYMTQLYGVNDLICAEIQKIQPSNNQIILHTRNIKYGQLLNGELIQVNHNLIKRCKQHYQSLHTIHIHIILGNNGAIWIYDPTVQPVKNINVQNNNNEQLQLIDQYTIYTPELIQSLATSYESRQSIARVYNCIKLLESQNKLIWNHSIMQVYLATLQLNLSCKQICDKQYTEQIFHYILQNNIDTTTPLKKQRM